MQAQAVPDRGICPLASRDWSPAEGYARSPRVIGPRPRDMPARLAAHLVEDRGPEAYGLRQVALGIRERCTRVSGEGWLRQPRVWRFG
eukprot:8859114-Pyramimonas_sp.AAC.1